ncbi:L,D-transpeptidase family protein [Alsobacter sp. SYSU M60028]|uniref:L,D-transpeptidase family protein n=1 Tax=Alsobacter ponti TaxID=2962936 RepID=A0ABT1LF32_9HYPH|nr:L,D-transpeptidase family protein [Alsobacter ponti]MCP8938853.1 L,D-transpeptidase family protein [Alsobacter ponti]
MRIRAFGVLSAGVCLAALVLAGAPSARAEGGAVDAPPAVAQAAGPEAAGEDGPNLVLPLAEQNLPALPEELQSATDVAQSIPLPEAPEGPLLVEDAAARAAREAAVDIPPPDLPPVTVVIDVPRADMAAAALRAELDAEHPSVAAFAQLARRDREAIAAFYATRADAPLWYKDGKALPAVRSVTDQLSRADEDGMDAAAYAAAGPANATPLAVARAELALSSAAYAYARDARGGRVEPTRLSKLLTPPIALPAPAEVLARLAAASNPGATLADYQPAHPGYRALRQQLAMVKEATAAMPAHGAIPPGPVLRTGARDARVPALRARLGAPDATDTLYDSELADLVAEVQRAHGLKATGRFDAATANALNGTRRATGVTAAEIIANMERWRWLPRDLGERHILVNVPDYSLSLVEDGRVVHEARVIVGKPDTPTPVFSEPMRYVVVNPYWNIPPSIMRNEILPKMAQDPDYAAKHGYEVVRRNGSLSVRQPPGERNALGFIKFLFPNQHSVYLHDTPSRRLFATDRRAYSHGCVRVDQPFRLAEFLLGAQGYDEARMRGLIGKGERTITLKQPVPVHIAYFTLFVDESGRLQRRQDIYGYDEKIQTALGISADGRRYAHLR